MSRRVVVLLLLCCVAGSASGVLPQEKSVPSASDILPPNPTIVSIPTDDEFYFGKTRVTRAEIPEKIKQALKDKPLDEQVVYVKASSFVRYGTVVSLIDTIREAGFDQIGLVADKKDRRDVKRKVPANKVVGSIYVSLSATPAEIVIKVWNRTRRKLNPKPMLLSRLENPLQALLNVRTNKTVFIIAPERMTYGEIMKVIDIAKSAGAQPVGLQVDHLNESLGQLLSSSRLRLLLELRSLPFLSQKRPFEVLNASQVHSFDVS